MDSEVLRDLNVGVEGTKEEHFIGDAAKQLDKCNHYEALKNEDEDFDGDVHANLFETTVGQLIIVTIIGIMFFSSSKH